MVKKTEHESHSTHAHSAQVQTANSATNAINPAESFPENFYADPRGLDRYVVQEKVLFNWKAPNKIPRKRKRSDYVQAVLVMAVIGLILLLLGEFLLTLVLATVTFLFILTEVTPPTYLNCLVTTLGLKVEDNYYYWSDFTQFWFEERRGSQILFLRYYFPTPHVIKFIIYPQDEEKIKVTIGKYLLYKKPKENSLEKMAKQVAAMLPFDLDFM